MKALFNDVLDMDDIRGVIVFSNEGKTIFEEFLFPPPRGIPSENEWDRFAQALNGVREADLLYGNNRIYIKKVELGYLLIVMGLLAPVAMVRMSCDMISPSLKRGVGSKSKGLKGFFRIKK